jgi:hypothetical protein
VTKHVLAVLVAVFAFASVALLAARSEASASGSGDPRIAVLQKQVKTLQKQVKTLQTQDKTLTKSSTEALAVAVYELYSQTCMGALTADLFQGTWISIDQVTQKTTFGPQTQVNDYGACSKLSNPAVPRTSPITSPPTINPLLPLLQSLNG